MSASIRWLFLLPAMAAAACLAFGGMTLVVNIVSWINIVPQNDRISLVLANFTINFAAAWAAVAAGWSVAPAKTRTVCIAIGAVAVVFALLTLAFGVEFRESLRMSMGWHVWSTVAWLAGTVFGVVQTGALRAASE